MAALKRLLCRLWPWCVLRELHEPWGYMTHEEVRREYLERIRRAGY